MRRKFRRIQLGYAYHVINRGVERRRLFSCDEDYRAFDQCVAFVKSARLATPDGEILMPGEWESQ